MEEQTHSAVLAGLFQVLGSTSGQDVACHDLLSCFLRPSPLLEPIETFGWDHGSQNISRAQLQSPLHLETVWSSSLLVEASGQNSVWCPFLAGSGTGGGSCEAYHHLWWTGKTVLRHGTGGQGRPRLACSGETGLWMNWGSRNFRRDWTPSRRPCDRKGGGEKWSTTTKPIGNRTSRNH